MAICTKCIFDPAGMINGGFSGVAIIVRELTDGAVPLWLTTAILNVPLFIATWIILGFKFIKKTLFTTVMFSVWLYIIPDNLFNINDYFLVCVFGAIISGLSIGIVYAADSSMGGTDTLATILQYYRRDISAVRFLQLVDGVIAVASGLVFGLERTLYALVSIYIAAKASELILEGANFAKKVYIISEEMDLIAEKVLHDLDRGMTYISSKGAYTGNEKKMALCIVSRRQITALKDIVKETDPNAFMVVSDAREVLGEGFL